MKVRPDHKVLFFILISILAAGSTSYAQDAGKYADVNGIRMYYEVRGAGQPLVLIHGGGSTINTTFGRILPLLAKTHKVIAVELQAHGRTSDRNAPESFAQDAADVAELLNQLKIPRADIFGFSNGGQTAIELGIKHPKKVRKLIIASAFYKRSGVPAEFWKGFENPKFSDMPQVYKDEFLKLRNDPAALMNMFKKDAARMYAFSDWKDEEIRSIRAPALVVIGDRDLPSAEHAAEMSRLLPSGRLAIIPGNHGSYIGEVMSPDPDSRVPQAFLVMIEEFLAAPVENKK
jgi:pimeloyl-ACP methyl ester carboxylesterase